MTDQTIDELADAYNDDEQTLTEREKGRLFDERSDLNPYTVDLNGRRYALSTEMRHSIEQRARNEYSENETFSCYWKVARKPQPNNDDRRDQYTQDEWEENVHEDGDPVLVIETRGTTIPWERLDTLNVEMQEVGPDSQFDGAGSDDSVDSGNGMQTIDPSDIDDASKDIGRTHFGITPQQYEEVPSPDGEEPDKIPQEPVEMDADPKMVAWVPEHPEIDHKWSAGEAICPMFTSVEWNVQQYANQPRPINDKDDSHDHWESILRARQCEKIGEVQVSQQPDNSDKKSGQVDRKGEDQFENGKYGGNNWQV